MSSAPTTIDQTRDRSIHTYIPEALLDRPAETHLFQDSDPFFAKGRLLRRLLANHLVVTVRVCGEKEMYAITSERRKHYQIKIVHNAIA